MNWQKGLKGKVRLDEPLKKHTTFKIGGPARFFIEPIDVEDLRLSLGLAKKEGLPVFVIGAGSNLLVNDGGLNGVIIRLCASYFKEFSCYNGNIINAGGGLALGRLVWSVWEMGLSGAEFLTGIPGTVGGALAMNAGVSEKGHNRSRITRSIGQIVQSVTVMDSSGRIRILGKKEINFGYRESSLSRYIILSALLKMKKEGKSRINRRIRSYLESRLITQDLSKPSAGCIFRNPKGDSAGRLIDSCGLKGKRIGDAAVSLKHANFILNLGYSSSREVIKLMDLIEGKVKERFDIDLEPEIKIWG